MGKVVGKLGEFLPDPSASWLATVALTAAVAAAGKVRCGVSVAVLGVTVVEELGLKDGTSSEGNTLLWAE